jgi:Spy/CpxP family protein refolding chaperone
MTRFQRIASVASLFTFLAAGTAAVAHADTAATEPAAHGHHHRGHGDLLRASLRLDSLTAAQRQQIEGLVAQEKATHANVRAARSQLFQALASGVAAGNVDDIALSPQVRAVETAMAADEPTDRATLEKLHAVLTPAQRTELVTRVEAHMQRGGALQHADAGATGRREGMGPWAHALNLTDAQRQQIGANLRSIGPAVDPTVRKDARESRLHVVEAFKGDRFVMSEVAPLPDPRLLEQEALRPVRLAKAGAPVLTPEQRATAAGKLRDVATREAK